MEVDQKTALREKEALVKEKSGLQQELLRVEHEKQDLVAEKSGSKCKI